MKRRELLAAGAATLAAPWVHAQSSAWPTKGPIRLICQYPPGGLVDTCLLYTSPSPRDRQKSRMPSSA